MTVGAGELEATREPVVAREGTVLSGNPLEVGDDVVVVEPKLREGSVEPPLGVSVRVVPFAGIVPREAVPNCVAGVDVVCSRFCSGSPRKLFESVDGSAAGWNCELPKPDRELKLLTGGEVSSTGASSIAPAAGREKDVPGRTNEPVEGLGAVAPGVVGLVPDGRSPLGLGKPVVP